MGTEAEVIHQTLQLRMSEQRLTEEGDPFVAMPLTELSDPLADRDMTTRR